MVYVCFVWAHFENLLPGSRIFQLNVSVCDFNSHITIAASDSRSISHQFAVKYIPGFF